MGAESEIVGLNLTPAVKRQIATHKARTDLLAFVCACDSYYDPAPFHARLARLVQDAMVNRLHKRVIISVPPRFGKSRMTSIEAPAFLLGHHPTKEVVVASYSAGLSIKASKAVKRRVKESRRYAELFPDTKIRFGDDGSEEWSTTAGGRFQATGIGGQLVGTGVDVMIIDDPYKNRQEAESKTMRDRVWDWFLSTAFTRLSPDGVIVVVATRWHKDDLSGRLTDPERIEELRDAGSMEEEFKVMNFHAMSKGAGDALNRPEGESLWPSRWTSKRLKAIRAALGLYEYSSLYDGEPSERESNEAILKSLHFIDPNEVPAGMEQARSYDLAVTDGESSDFNAGARGGFDRASGRFYITDMHHKRSRWHVTQQDINRNGDMDGLGSRIRIEAVGAFESLFEIVRKDRMGKNILSMVKPTTNKFVRASPWLAAIEAGLVYVVRGAWNRNFLDELVLFPNGKHDDQIDAVSGLWEMTAKRQPLLYA